MGDLQLQVPRQILQRTHVITNKKSNTDINININMSMENRHIKDSGSRIGRKKRIAHFEADTHSHTDTHTDKHTHTDNIIYQLIYLASPVTKHSGGKYQ